MLGGMQEPHKDALLKLRVKLIQDMLPDELLEHLTAKKVLTPYMQEKIQAKAVSFRQNSALLDLLPKRGPNAFFIFCAALRDTNQEHLAEQLEHRARSAAPEVRAWRPHGCRDGPCGGGAGSEMDHYFAL
ncbi:hypothetical protein GDO78_018515 [Eleutherodactylus coqui]|uniref:CARD domain-containing protein n=1 Tax=Eleutherodactylus coqui TaxID=57060 RepID=A0A8J6BDF1_ELECQ|nr:hypothetical protein GDO78_018515 [Eleutherodactylus coqui]